MKWWTQFTKSNDPVEFLAAFLVALTVWIALVIAQRFAGRALARASECTEVRWDDLLAQAVKVTNPLLFLPVAAIAQALGDTFSSDSTTRVATVRRQNGMLRVRNPIYERVFDERWARDHLRLHVNWRRRLATVAAALLVLTVVLTIPLAYYARRQKVEAEFQRDDAVRRGQITEESFNKRAKTLEDTQKVAEELKTSNPVAAEAIGTIVAEGKEEVRKDRATLAAPAGVAAAPTRDPPARGSTRTDRATKPATAEPVAWLQLWTRCRVSARLLVNAK